MDVDENVFFREATLRICSSLDIVTALKRCFEYIRAFIPANGMTLHILDPDLNLLKFVASVGLNHVNERVLHLPEKGRDKRAADLQAAFLANEGKVLILHPDKEAGLPEILEQLGINANISLMNLILQLEGNRIGTLALYTDGLNQYSGEHARLLQLLHGPFAIAMSNALEHQETIRFKDEHMSHLQFFQNMDRINRAMQRTNDLEETMIDVLDAMLSIFDSDRAFLLYPCDPDAPSFEIAMERTRPEYPIRRGVISTAIDIAEHFRLYLASTGAVTLGPGCDYPLETSRFGEKSKIMMASHPKTGKPWVLGMHQCSYPRVWSRDEKNLLKEIARRVNDVLTGLLAYRDLHESEECHRVTLQTAMDGFFRADKQGRILEVNETYCRMSGYSGQELLTMNIADIEAVHSAEMIAANIRRFTEEGPQRFESLHRRKNGSLFDVEISGQHQAIAGGQVVAFVRDITERKQAEDRLRHTAESLRRSEAYLAEAQRLSHTGSWAFDLDSGKFLYASEECLRMYEHDAQEGLPGREATFRLIHPEDRDSVQGGFEKSLREKVDTSSEFRLVLPSGTVKHVQTIRHPVLNEAGDVVQLVGTTIDITERKQAEEKIRQHETELRQVLDFTPHLVGVFGLDRKLLYASRPTLDYIGLTLEEWKGISDPFWFFHPDDRERVAKDVYTGAANDVPHEFEARLRRKDGTYRWFLFRDNPLRDEQGLIMRWYVSATDIEDRKQTEQALQDSEVNLNRAQEIAHIGSWRLDIARNQLTWSNEVYRLFDRPGGTTLSYEAFFDMVYREDRELVDRAWAAALQGAPYDIEHRILVGDELKWVRERAEVEFDEQGKAVKGIGTVQDITERKRAEAEINSLKNYLSNIIDSMPSILVGMDNARTVTQWNRQAEAFTGIPAGEAIGKPIADLLPDFAPWIITMGHDIGEHPPSSMEKLLIEKEGERRFYDLMRYPLLVGSAEGAVLRIEDVTERARIQELMIQTEKMMSIGGLAAGMAHEINNPLGIITQAAQNIERRISLELPANRKVSEELGLNLEGIHAYFDKRQITDAIASIRTASARAAKIVSNMLKFSRRADTTTEPASFAQIVDQALELAASDYDLKKKYDFRNIEIIKDYQDTTQVLMVSLEIEQVILNLLKNAAQAMTATPPDRRPSITCRLRCEGRYAVLEVEDNGPGMTEDIRRRVFEPFFTTKEPGVGTGLGLSVSYVIVTQNHKGLMEVQSTPGRGTVFKVRLPIGGSQT